MMKYNIILGFLVSCFLWACSSGTKENEEPGFFESVSVLKKVADEVDDIEEEEDWLLKAKPIDNTVLKDLLPERYFQLEEGVL